MKICLECNIFFHERVMQCQKCDGKLLDISLPQALKLSEHKSVRDNISGKYHGQISDSHKQYHLRSYIGNRSLFLDFDLHRNRLKHGPRLKRFFIAPLNFTVFFNLPWFFFNVVATNLFHMNYTCYCSRCNTKYVKNSHNKEECDYNIEYFQILDDIINGSIVYRKKIYDKFANEKRLKNVRCAFNDLYKRNIRWEAFWDILSIGLSIFFWLYIAVFISYPMIQILIQKISQIEAYEFSIATF